MALIIKKGDKSKNQQRQIYTWAACIFIALFLISVAGSALSGDKGDRSNKYKDAYYDLANMPFANDAAEAELLASARYSDIAKTDLISTLFSRKQKEERQLEDLEEGEPAPPDEDYKQAVVQKEAAAVVADRKEKAVAKATATASARPVAPKAPTQRGALQSGGRSMSGGGGTSASGSIWRGDPNNNKGTGKNAKDGGKPNASDLSKDLKAGGRGSGYFNAYEKSVEAGKEKDAGAAAGLAADAFHDGKADGNLNSALEKAADELGSLDAGADARPPDSDLGDKLNDKKDKLDKAKKDDKDEDACGNMFKSAGNFFSCLGQKTIEAGIQAGTTYLTGLATPQKGTVTADSKGNITVVKGNTVTTNSLDGDIKTTTITNLKTDTTTTTCFDIKLKKPC